MRGSRQPLRPADRLFPSGTVEPDQNKACRRPAPSSSCEFTDFNRQTIEAVGRAAFGLDDRGAIEDRFSITKRDRLLGRVEQFLQS
jgi:hypothetical protein